ncbi:MAG: SCO family protein [Planctomycetes bacterium]|nr:SCO family protein [Planctomycetota bacterium]
MNSTQVRRPRSTLQGYLLLGTVALVLGTVYALVLRNTAKSSGEGSVLAAPADSKESFAEIRPFTLLDQSGATFTRDTLMGRPSIVGFIFTRCSGPCPLITANMKKVHDQIAGDDIRLVTITVDPEYDTPAVLSEYARNIGADLTRWTFLTGPTDEVQRLSEKSFLLPIEKDESQPVGESITHRTYLTVVDKTGRVRGYYDGEGPVGLEAAVKRARYLAAEQ